MGVKYEKNKFLQVYFLEIQYKFKYVSLVPYIIIWHSRLFGPISVIGNYRYKSSSVPIQLAH